MSTSFLATTGFGAQLEVDSMTVEFPAYQEEDSEQMVVRRAQEGDQSAYRLLVERYQSRAHAVAFGILGSVEDAEDVIQEAFIKAYRKLPSFRGQSSFFTWLYRIVFNLAVDLSRRKYRRSEKPLGSAFMLDNAVVANAENSEFLLSRGETPDEYLRRVEIQNRFREALGNLSVNHRAVIVLREVEGLSYEEISRVVGCSKGTVMSRLHHARKRLQEALGDLMPTKEHEPEKGRVIKNG